LSIYLVYLIARFDFAIYHTHRLPKTVIIHSSRHTYYQEQNHANYELRLHPNRISIYIPPSQTYFDFKKLSCQTS
jgi:hypothetical protein